MVSLFIGAILLLAPFSLLGLISDKKTGFIYVSFFLLIFCSALAIITQALSIFYYWLILAVFFVADFAVIFFIFKSRKKYSFSFKDIDWAAVALLISIFLCFYQVHFRYTGEINLATDQTVSYHQVKNMVYPYPYFSDEWYAAGLAKDSISHHFLPIVNFLLPSRHFFINGEAFFHSFLAEVFLIFNIDPINNYGAVSLFFNLLIVLLVYLVLRKNNVKKVSALISSFFVPLLSFGANIPGTWYLIPINLGIIISLLGAYFISAKKMKMALWTGLLVFLFYPPLVIFYGPALATFLNKKVLKKIAKFSKQIAWSLAAFVVIFLVLMIFSPVFSKIMSFVFSKVFYISFSGKNLFGYGLFEVVPFYVVALAVVGMWKFYKDKKWIFLQVLIGSAIWLFCSFSYYRFFIEQQRAIFYTSILLVIFAGLGIKVIEDYFGNIKYGNRYVAALQTLAIILILISIPFYTTGQNWKTFISRDPSSGAEYYPKAPANNYLTPDDLSVFKSINGKKFLSIPWKGTVIGIATGNYPVSSKDGTISINTDEYNKFILADCRGKKKMAKNIDYFYMQKINCPGFKKMAKSKEGLILYTYNNDK